MTNRWSISCGLLVLASPALAVAHPGHASSQPWHEVVLDPGRMLPAAIVVGVVALGGVVLRRIRGH
jgi:hypothetical protein